MLIQHENVRPPQSRRTQGANSKFHRTVPLYSPYSLDLVPSDFHLLGPLKDALRGTMFEDDRVIRAVDIVT